MSRPERLTLVRFGHCPNVSYIVVTYDKSSDDMSNPVTFVPRNHPAMLRGDIVCPSATRALSICEPKLYHGAVLVLVDSTFVNTRPSYVFPMTSVTV